MLTYFSKETARKITDPIGFQEFEEEIKLSSEIEEFLGDVYKQRFPAHAYNEVSEAVYQDFYGYKLGNPEENLKDLDILPEIPETNICYETVHLGKEIEEETNQDEE